MFKITAKRAYELQNIQGALDGRVLLFEGDGLMERVDYLRHVALDMYEMASWHPAGGVGRSLIKGKQSLFLVSKARAHALGLSVQAEMERSCIIGYAKSLAEQTRALMRAQEWQEALDYADDVRYAGCM